MLGVIVTHGIGDQSPAFADDFIEAVNARLPPEVRHRLRWEPFYWADMIPKDTDEGRYLYPHLRDMFDNTALDLMGYLLPENYGRIQGKLRRLWRMMEDAGCGKIAVLAHSLGTVIAANHIHDNHLSPNLLVTFGSPLHQYLLRRGSPPSITPQRWINYYHPTDIIAKPIGNLGPSYRVEDISIITKYNPFHILPVTHTTYWSSQRFIRRIAHHLKETV